MQNDFRIGNIVNAGALYLPYGEGVVCEILADCLTINVGGKINQYPYDGVAPVLITEEKLLELGFEENYRSKTRVNYDHKDFMFIGYDINLSGIDNAATGLRYYGSHIKVDYLHDLQNAFKVFTGEELTINL